MLVVQQLIRSPRSGYALVKDIHERTGWKPSFGSIYPLLERMQQDDLVTVKEQGRSKVYSLTVKGKQTFEQQHEKRVQLFSQVAEQVRVLECLGEEEAQIAAQTLEVLKRGEVPFQDIPEASQIKQELFRLLSEEKTITKRTKIRAILKNTAKELRKL